MLLDILQQQSPSEYELPLSRIWIDLLCSFFEVDTQIEMTINSWLRCEFR